MAKDDTVVKENTSEVKFTAEQLAVIEQMISKAKAQPVQSGDAGISVYGQRDPKKIETVNVKRVNGKFVVGFKDVQDDPLKKVPKYLEYRFDPVRKLDRQPYITLILSDGKGEEELEMLLIDYYNSRDSFQAPVKEVVIEKHTHDHGFLGSSAEARAIDDKGNLLPRSSIKAESQSETRKYVVELPGFKETVLFVEDWLA